MKEFGMYASIPIPLLAKASAISLPGTLQCPGTQLNEIELLNASSLILLRHSTRVTLFITQLFRALMAEELSESMYMFLFAIWSSLSLEQAADIAVTSA